MSATAVYDFKTLRESKGLVQVRLAVLAHTTEGMINRIEKHGYIPGYAVRRRIARILEVDMKALWPDVDDSDYE